MEKNFDHIGKKIFLLYPHSVIRDEMLDLLIMAGFETYTILDEKRAKKFMAKFPGSIMFINIDEGLRECEWEAYVKNLQDDPMTKNSKIGIMSYNQDQGLMKKYLIDMEIPCGYIQLKLGLKESTQIILKALNANEARGKRQCIRADCSDDIHATVNYKIDKNIYNGKILDISSAGISAKFDKLSNQPMTAPPIENVQLKLHGGLVMADMHYIGQRKDNKFVQILLFDSNLSDSNKLVIHRYIKQRLQKYINTLKV